MTNRSVLCPSEAAPQNRDYLLAALAKPAESSVGMSEAFDRLMQGATDDPGVVGVVVGGSRGKRLGTPHSDWDVYVVVRSEGDLRRVSNELRIGSREIDLCGVFTVEQFEAHASVGDDSEWNRYNFAHLNLPLDRTPGGLLQRLCDEKEWLPDTVARHRAAGALDAYLNSYHRALKNDRDGNHVAARLDAAEAVPRLVEFVFTAERRARPYNKFLAWELTVHPLDREWWPTSDVTSLLLDIIATGSLPSLAAAFRTVEAEARGLGFGHIVDAWGAWAVNAMRAGTTVP